MSANMSPYCSNVGGDPVKRFIVLLYLICVSADMSPYFSAHDEWRIMKRCMYRLYVGYHDANNVSNFGGDPVSQLN